MWIIVNRVRTSEAILSCRDKNVLASKSTTKPLESARLLPRNPETHTKERSDATSAETPETMMMARARLEPVPPPGAVMIAEG